MKSFPEKYFLPLLLALTIFLALWKLGATPLMEWDESRNGVTAIEMRDNGEYLNPHYGGELEEWSVKPPLFIWLVILSYETFGENAFALRFPSALASIGSVFFIFKIIRLFRSAHFAGLVILMLLSAKGFLGPHVGRSGDYDPLLIFFLLGGLYYFLSFLQDRKQEGFLATGLFWGLAFWTKGPAAFIILPGLVLYLLISGRLLFTLKQAATWKAISLFVLVGGSWVVAIYFYGGTFSNDDYAGNNAFQRIFINDIIDRFTDSNFEQETHPRDYDFFFTYLDARFNLWAYLFYTALLLLLIRGKQAQVALKEQINRHPLLFLSVCLWFSCGLFFTFATTKQHWYLAPVLPFIAITLVYGIYPYWSKIKYLVILLLIFTLGRQVYYFSYPAPLPDTARVFNQILKDKEALIVKSPLPKQHHLLYLHFEVEQIFYRHDISKLNENPPTDLLFLTHPLEEETAILSKRWKLKEKVKGYFFLEKRE